MKGLILTAGKGTRLRPMTYTKPKPLLPVANQPVINYGIEHLYNLGIREIGLVIQPHDEEIFKNYVQSYKIKDIKFHYIYQYEQKGLAHAVGKAEDFIGSDSFVLLLGDNLIEESLALLMDSFNKEKINGTVMVTKVDSPKDYGIAEIENGKIKNLEEKPVNPKSDLAVIGAYIFDATIFKAIHSISPSARGEYEITDAIQWMIDHGYAVNYVNTNEPTFDVGTVERWLEANQSMLKKVPSQWDDDFEEGITQNSIIIPPVIIGENCKVENSVIGPYVSIESNVVIKQCHIKNSIVLKGSCLRDVPYEITDSVFGERAKMIGKNINNNSIYGIFGDDSTLHFSNSNSNKKE
ncbi:glucose-1-phosphate thymidylyltransferase [Oceanobacillus rekensis]|uniref:glucose-1-phosphate thymidylyltransferase n=1 Tax=Oceanobacillus rekensis TaxID=937927 RepID=UPI000B42E8F7|nr:glucose-1-phosphate thymidylyltransferase [Oceanobacillus rekensis]